MIKTISIQQLGALPYVRKLKDIASSASRILTLSLADEAVSKASALSVSIEKGRVSMAYASKFLSVYTLEYSKTFNFSENSYPGADEVASAVSMFLSEKGLRPAAVTLSVPKAWTIMKISEFPAAAADNLFNAIPYEMDRLTPFTAEEVFYDFRTLGTAGGKVSFLLAAVKAETVKTYLDALKNSGHIVGRLTTNPSALGTLAHFIDKGKNSSHLLLEITADNVEASVVIDGTVRSVLSSAVSQPEAKAPAVEELINTQIAKLKKNGHSPSVIGHFKDPDPRLKEILRSKVPGVRFIDELNFRIKGISDKKNLPLNALGGALEALLPGRRGLDLISRGRVEKIKQSYILTLVLVAAFLILAAVFSISPLWKEKALIGVMDKKIGELKKNAVSVEKIKQEIDTFDKKVSSIKDFSRGDVRKIVILRELTRIIPDDTWLNRIRIAEDSIEIYGYSEAATKLIPKLSASKYLTNVEFASPTMKDSKMDMDRFAIRAKIKK